MYDLMTIVALDMILLGTPVIVVLKNESNNQKEIRAL